MANSGCVQENVLINGPGNVCALCGISVKLSLCAGCRNVYYCSKQHQKQHWKNHKPLCRASQNVNKQNKVSQVEDNLPNNIKSVEKEKSDKMYSQIEEQKVDLSNLHIDTKPKVEFSLGVQSNPTFMSNFDNSQDIHSMETVSHNSSQIPYAQQFGISDPLQKTTKQRQRAGAINGERRFALDTPRETKIADYVVTCLNSYGICVVDHFLSELGAEEILKEVKSLNDSNRMRDGEILNSVKTEKKIRGDKIAWIEKGDRYCPNISALIHRLDSLMLTCNGRLSQYNVNGRTRAMVACYPGEGTYYMKHIDNPNGDGRCVTCIYYINKDWNVKEDGGLLRIFPTMWHNQVADIEPKFDRLLFFWSDRRNPHEVQPAYRTRFAITVWFFDKEEREQATQKHQNQQRTLNAIEKTTSVPLTNALEEDCQGISAHGSWP